MLGSLYVTASRSKQVRSIESFFCVFYRVFLREVLRLPASELDLFASS